MPITCCGIDEAGYGPMLGPLCIAAAAFRVTGPGSGPVTGSGQGPGSGPAGPDHAHDRPPPDLWRLLERAVCRAPRDHADRIAIADSKRLKRPNTLKRAHPLEHLERGVLACLQAQPDTDAELLHTLGARLPDAPCYRAEPTPLPLARDAAAARIDASRLAAAMHRAGVELVGLRCVIVGERTFNETVRSAGTKARATALGIVPLARWAARRASAAGDRLELICDQQSGRTDDTPLLAECFPHAEISRTRADAAGRRYHAGDAIGVRILPEAEDHHLPVALASMTAKLVRELAMRRFNAYWSARLPALKPTAGYVADARRWLRDVEPVLDPAQRDALVRIA